MHVVRVPEILRDTGSIVAEKYVRVEGYDLGERVSRGPAGRTEEEDAP